MKVQPTTEVPFTFIPTRTTQKFEATTKLVPPTTTQATISKEFIATTIGDVKTSPETQISNEVQTSPATQTNNEVSTPGNTEKPSEGMKTTIMSQPLASTAESLAEVTTPSKEEEIKPPETTTKVSTVHEVSLTTSSNKKTTKDNEISVTSLSTKFLSSDLTLTTKDSSILSTKPPQVSSDTESLKVTTIKASATKEPSISLPAVIPSNSSRGNESAAFVSNGE